MAGTPLRLDEREEIRAGIERCESAAAIARQLGRHPTTVSREIRRSGGRYRYRAARAQTLCDRRRRRPKTPKLLADKALARTVEAGLRQGFSPPAVAALLRAAGGPRVVHETIYQALYSRTFRGLTLLPRNCLRTRRPRRRHHGRRKVSGFRGLGRGFRLIDDRPAAARDRSEPGHWEGDLILGTRVSGSAIATLVERSSRLIVLAPLPRGSGALELRHVLLEALSPVPPRMRRTLTWDQGSEMRCWRDLESELDLPVFFCHPRSPWERGSNENANRQLRYWFPKGTDITAHPSDYFERVTFILNHQPRRLLGWSSSAQRYGELAVH